MRVVVALLALVAVAYGQGCGTTPVAPDETRIVGGHTAVPYSWPWQIEMCFTAQTNGGGACNLRCGGTVISPDWILSASHCVDGYVTATQRFKIKAGIYQYASTNEAGMVTVNVDRIVMHPQYNRPKELAHDMALLHLATPLTYTNHIQPVCLPANSAAEVGGNVGGTSLIVTGWGTTSEGGSVSSQLRQVVVPSLTDAACNRQYNRNELDTTTMFCAGVGGKDSCQGDSGGPIVLKRVNGRWYQPGIVSWGYGCAEAGHAGVYAKVSSMCDFITSTTGSSLCIA